MPGVPVGAYSAVTSGVEPYTLGGGNPAQPIRKRYAPDEVGLLLQARWWDWPVEAITGTPRR